MDIIKKLEDRAISYEQSGPSAHHTAALLREAKFHIEDLAMMLRRMIWMAEKQAGDNSVKGLAGSAKQLLAKYNLKGSPLREVQSHD
jgi:orotate phosphoribosyltransferase